MARTGSLALTVGASALLFLEALSVEGDSFNTSRYVPYVHETAIWSQSHVIGPLNDVIIGLLPGSGTTPPLIAGNGGLAVAFLVIATFGYTLFSRNFPRAVFRLFFPVLLVFELGVWASLPEQMPWHVTDSTAWTAPAWWPGGTFEGVHWLLNNWIVLATSGLLTLGGFLGLEGGLRRLMNRLWIPKIARRIEPHPGRGTTLLIASTLLLLLAAGLFTGLLNMGYRTASVISSAPVRVITGAENVPKTVFNVTATYRGATSWRLLLSVPETTTLYCSLEHVAWGRLICRSPYSGVGDSNAPYLTVGY